MLTGISSERICIVAGKRATKRRLRALEDAAAEARREAGALAVAMYRDGRFDAEELANAGVQVNEIGAEIAKLRQQLGIEPEPELGEAPQPSDETAEYLAIRAEQTSEFPALEPDPTPAPDASASQSEAVLAETDLSADADRSLKTEQFGDTETETGAEPEPAVTAVEATPAPPTGDTQSPIAAAATVAAEPESPVKDLLAAIEQAERDSAQRAADLDETPDLPAALDELDTAFEEERKRAAETVARLERRLEQAERAAAAAEARAMAAEEERRAAEARSRTAAAEWLRREADTIRAEAAGAESQTGEIARLESELKRVRAEKAEALQAAESRLAEIEKQAESAGRLLDQAEDRLAGDAAAKLAAAEARADAAEARADAAEAEARQAAAAWLRSQAKIAGDKS